MARGATHANVSASATTVVLFAAQEAVSMRSVWNDSTSAMYLKYGATAAATSAVVKIPADSYFEFPRPTYDGLVHAIWTTATGTARTTEVA